MKKDTSKPLLLDVNVLLALAWPNHQFHRAARTRLDDGDLTWAGCALTQLAFVRLSATPAIVDTPKPISEALEVLTAMTADPRHTFWEALPAVADLNTEGAFRWAYGHRQINDAYLLALALPPEACLLTFDQRLAALAQDPAAVEIIS